MKRIQILILFLISFIVSGFGQTSDSKSGIGLIELAEVNQGNSYFTSPTDIGNIEPLWFEVNIVPNFYLRKSKNSRLLGVFTPQIILRMYQERSYPVRTPSYMPQITIYYLFTSKESIRKYSLFGRYAHHSNGQDGDFFEESGSINLKSGDFATNSIETGLIVTNINTRLNFHRFFKSAIEIHPQDWSGKDLEGIYSKIRWHNTLSIYKLPTKMDQKIKKKADISIKGETTWMFGKLNNWTAFSLNRLNISFTFYYHPRFMEDIGLFAQYYLGSDYYNIYFSHRLDVFRFGLMIEKLRF